ncbi:MAG: Stp1/IreP family PP2C-type Ser/Thr phosphatase, partial [Chloroflexi bacterium]|nr:Stp1/IreP family PP2C-type Ser/Thr phosphatase [Chloroflexota bacterium]
MQVISTDTSREVGGTSEYQTGETAMVKEVTRLRVGAKTDPGRRRELNEDDFIIVEMFKDKENLAVAEKKGNLYIVADGVGGHNAGEVASRMAVDIVSQRYYEDESPNVRFSLLRAIQEANRQIFERAQSVRSETGMGSTIVAAVIRGHELHVAHAGDSRAYLVREGRIEPLTKDHSWLSEQLTQNRITPEEARTHPYRSYITRCLGIKPEVEPEYDRPLAIRQGDVIILCSDGLSGQVDDGTILRIVSAAEPADACDELVRLANEASGPDNITAVVIRVEEVVPTSPQYGAEAPTRIPGERSRQEKLKRQKRERKRRMPATKTIIRGLVIIGTICLCILLAVLLFQREQQLREKDQEIHQMGSTATALAALLPPVLTETPTSTPSHTPRAFATERTTPTSTRAVALIFTEMPSPTSLPPTATATPRPFPTSTATSASAASPTLLPPTETVTPQPSSTRTATPTSVPSPTDTATITPSPTPTPWLRVLVGNLNVRAEPRMGYGVVLGQVHWDDRLPVLGRSKSGLWLKICCFGPVETEGWVSSSNDLVEVSV